MPVDEQKILNNSNGQQPPAQSQPSSQPAAAAESTALTALTQTAASTIRQSIATMSQLADKLEDQRNLVTDHAADRVASILDPHSIQAEIAVKTLEKLEGKSFVPFELEAIELPEVQRYVPQLPASYVSQSLPTLLFSSDVTPSETTSNGKQPTAAGKGFAMQRDRS